MKEKIIKRSVYILTLVIISVLVLINIRSDYKADITLYYDLIGEQQDIYQVFYSVDGEWNEEMSIKQEYVQDNIIQKMSFEIPKNTKYIRIDLGSKGYSSKLSNIYIKYGWEKIRLYDYLANLEITDIKSLNNIKDIYEENNVINIEVNGLDPYLIIKLDNQLAGIISQIDKNINLLMKLMVCIVIIFMLEVVRRKVKNIIVLMKDINANKKIMWKLALNDFKNKYTGSCLGIIWAFIHPVVIVAVYWFVFQVGFKSQPVDDFPFILWLVAGIVPWFFFNEAIMNATNSMLEYSYLVKKVVFKISILPIVKILSSLFVHLFFIGFTILLFMIYGYRPTVFTIQVFYYSICLIIFILAISYFTSAVVIFFKDLSQIIAICLQVGMWATPIMWSYNMIPTSYQWILKLNPLYYIVEGYRDSLINHIWFWERYNQTIYFWLITAVLFVIGTLTFKRLKVHFADIL